MAPEQTIRDELNVLHEALEDTNLIENDLRRLAGAMNSIGQPLTSLDEAIFRVGIARSVIRVRQGNAKRELNELLVP